MKEINLINSERKVTVDDEDYKWLMSLGGWSLHSSGRYAYNHDGLMHRIIYKKYHPELKENIDHINGDGLNNQKYNLREVTQKINGFNRHAPNKQKTIKYRGVFWIKNRKKWNCLIYSDKKCIYSEYFDTAKDAAIAYDIFISRFLPNILIGKNCPNVSKEDINRVTKIIDNPKKNKGNSKYKGVCYHPKRNQWRAYKTINKKQIHFGWFSTEEEAFKAYQKNIVKM